MPRRHADLHQDSIFWRRKRTQFQIQKNTYKVQTPDWLCPECVWDAVKDLARAARRVQADQAPRSVRDAMDAEPDDPCSFVGLRLLGRSTRRAQPPVTVAPTSPNPPASLIGSG